LVSCAALWFFSRAAVDGPALLRVDLPLAAVEVLPLNPA
jgi:hypothetical protein